jgi:hypothetical protein
MNFELENELRPFLSPDEKLLWTGKPKTGIMFRTMDIFLIPFSLLWCGFAVFWFVMAWSSNAPMPFALFGVPFVIIGLYFVFGRFVYDSLRRQRTVYGITDNRIIIRSGFFNKELKSLNIRTISDLNFKEKAGGSGTIALGPTDFRYAMFNGMYGWSGVKPIPSLEFIPEVRSVYDLIIKIQRSK